MKVLYGLFLLLILASCSPGPTSSRVVATTGMIGDLAHRIAGEAVAIDVMMGPGVDPHLYKATAGDVDRLGKAKLILYNGLHLEAKLGEVLEKLGSTIQTVAVAEGIPEASLLSDGAGGHDPHVWFDVSLWTLASERIHQALVDAFPEERAGFDQRYQVLRAELEALHQEVSASVATIPVENRVLVTAHDAFNYFGRAYGIDVRGLQGISTNDEASTRDIQDLAAFLVERKIPAVFVESSVSPRAIEALREAVLARGWTLKLGGELFSDALGSAGTPEGTYLGMVRHNVHTLVQALGGPHE